MMDGVFVKYFDIVQSMLTIHCYNQLMIFIFIHTNVCILCRSHCIIVRNYAILLKLFYFVHIGHSTTSNGSINTGFIIGGVIGGTIVVAVTCILLLLYCFYIRRKKPKCDESTELIQSKHYKCFLMHSYIKCVSMQNTYIHRYIII